MSSIAQEVFVPGRLCLFGEHSDWSGAFRRFNGDIEKGACLVLGTTQGLYARVGRRSRTLRYTATDNEGRRVGPFECPMDRAALLAEAEKGGFFARARVQWPPFRLPMKKPVLLTPLV